MPLRSLALLAAGCALAPACSYTFDEDAPAFSLTGPPALGRRVATVTDLDTLRFVEDAAGGPWLAIYRAGTGRALPSSVRAVQLDPPFADERFTADRIHVRQHALYLVDDGATAEAPARLRVEAPGTNTVDTFAMPPGDEVIVSAPGDVAFVYYVLGADTFVLQRRDGSARRILPAYTADDPLSFLGPVLLGGAAFDEAGERLLHRSDTCQGPRDRPPGRCRPAVAVRATRSDDDFLLQSVDAHAWIALERIFDRDVLVECGPTGLRVRPVERGGRDIRLLDPTPGCAPLFSAFRDLGQVASAAPWIREGKAYYRAGDRATGQPEAVRVVPLDGSAPPRTLLEGTDARVLALHPATGRIVYALDPFGTWASDASDGWLGGERFMERGVSATFSDDGARLRWLEHAANLSLVATGALLSIGVADIGHAPPLRLADNVTRFHQIADGRLVAAANHAFQGAQNRLVLLDERARTARLLAEHATSDLEIPGTSDVLAVELDGQGGYDLVRIALPPTP